jgi:glutamate:Na+ symporter, ESS family
MNMQNQWDIVLDICILSILLGMATYLKNTFKIFQKFLVPNSIIAGFLGLILGPEVLKALPLNLNRLGTLVYHLMAIGFISLSLKERKRDKSKGVVNTGFIIVSTYVIQGILGLALSLLLFYTVFPNLFPPMGLLLPLGYGQGPGQAYSIGKQWELSGFSNGSNVGLTLAALGFMWACLGGVPLMNYLIKNKKMKCTYKVPDHSANTIEEVDNAGDIPLSESIDRISVQMFLIGIVYYITYLFTKEIGSILMNFGSFGITLSNLLWGFNFIIGSLFALALRILFDKLKERKVMIRNYPNDFLLSRISGGCFDFMITASIAGISISLLKDYWIPIAIISTLGGIMSVFYVVIIVKKCFKNDVLENILASYGMLTGTLSTGLALLREVDPNFESTACKNQVLGSGVAVAVGFPMMIILNVPLVGYITNNQSYYFYTLAALILYEIFLWGYLYIANRKEKA